MDDAYLLRYGKHIILPQIDIEGQRRLGASRVLVVGAGGLGCPAAMYLAGSGVGELVIADGDDIELSNLPRQIAFDTAQVGQAKVDVLARRLRAMNPEVRISTCAARLAGPPLAEEVARADVVIDASDNFPTRFGVNEACVRYGRPLVSGALIRLEAQLSVFDTRRADSPCYRCLYGTDGEAGQACAETGVLAPLAGVVGSLQAAEALKLLAGFGEPLIGRVLVLDGAQMRWRSLQLRRDPACPVCVRRRPAEA